jgi:hypothetical protein
MVSPSMTGDPFILTLALVGVVIIIAALLSGDLNRLAGGAVIDYTVGVKQRYHASRRGPIWMNKRF